MSGDLHGSLQHFCIDVDAPLTTSKSTATCQFRRLTVLCKIEEHQQAELQIRMASHEGTVKELSVFTARYLKASKGN